MCSVISDNLNALKSMLTFWQHLIREEFTKNGQGWDIVPISWSPTHPKLGHTYVDFFIVVLDSTHHEMDFNNKKDFEKKSLYKMVWDLVRYSFIFI